MVGTSRSLIVSPNAVLQLHLRRSLVLRTETELIVDWLRNLAQARGPRNVYLLNIYPTSYLISILILRTVVPLTSHSLQCPELICIMAALACLTHHRTWHWPSGRLIQDCTVHKPQDQLSGTTHKANWCRGTTGRRCIKPVVVGLQYSPSKATNKAKVESTSAEWMF